MGKKGGRRTRRKVYKTKDEAKIARKRLGRNGYYKVKGGYALTKK